MNYQTKYKRGLGLDPGIANTGWAVVMKTARGYRLVADGNLIKTDASQSTGDRLLAIYQHISEVVATQLPDRIAVEKCYHNRNVSSSQSTGAVIGVVHLIGAQCGIPVSECTPQQVKSASGLGGSADKKAVQRMMCKMFQREKISNHVADAVACAIAGLLHNATVRNA